MEDFRRMTNDSIRIGLEFERDSGLTPSMKKMSLLAYGKLRQYVGFSQYRLCAMSKAAGILSSRRKSLRRGFPTKVPYLSRPILVSCYGFRIEAGNLVIHLGSSTFESIPLNSHTFKVISDSALKVSSFTLTERSLSLCVSKQVQEPESGKVSGAIGIDRNLRNLTVGNDEVVTFYDITKIVAIGERTRSIIKSFTRNDARARRALSSKYGRRRRERVQRILHLVSREVVEKAKAERQVIVFEDLGGIRRLYRKGNGQGPSYRSRMNSWPFYEVKRQIEYKATWEGVPVVTLTRRETRGTTIDCPRCGERLQVPVRGDDGHYRQLWCKVCRRWMDRDVCAVLNISRRGWLRFDHSSKEGEAGEAVKRNAEHEGEPLILRVDASKLRGVEQGCST